MREMILSCKILVGNPHEKGHLKDLGEDGITVSYVNMTRV
jgi:hypothetical protein